MGLTPPASNRPAPPVEESAERAPSLRRSEHTIDLIEEINESRSCLFQCDTGEWNVTVTVSGHDDLFYYGYQQPDDDNDLAWPHAE